MKFVWRLEDKFHIGFYNGSIRSIRILNHLDHNHPDYDQDYNQNYIIISSIPDFRKYHYGFSSLEQLFNWFDEREVIDYLIRGGFLVKIPVNENRYYDCQKQTIFMYDYDNEPTLKISYSEYIHGILLNHLMEEM